MPQKVEEFNKRITGFLNRSGAVLPRPNPEYQISINTPVNKFEIEKKDK